MYNKRSLNYNFERLHFRLTEVVGHLVKWLNLKLKLPKSVKSEEPPLIKSPDLAIFYWKERNFRLLLNEANLCWIAYEVTLCMQSALVKMGLCSGRRVNIQVLKLAAKFSSLICVVREVTKCQLYKLILIGVFLFIHKNITIIYF